MDKRFGLKIHCIEDITNVLKLQPEVEEALIFGSRAMGTYTNGSDIDIALKGKNITFDTISTIRLRLDELPYLYMYDIIDYKKVSNPAVTAHIDELGITFYKKEEKPSEWKTYKLSELVEIKYGKDHKHLADGEIPLYGSGGIMRYVDTPLYEQESILIPRKGTLSNLFYLNIPFWSVDTMFYTKIKAGNNGKYLYYLLKSMDLASMNVGSAVPSLTTEVLNKVEINVPDEATQIEIAQILSSLDDKIELNLQMNQTLEAMAQALFKEWFVNFNFPNFDGVLENGLPRGWKEVSLDDVIIDYRGKTPIKLGGQWSDEGIPALSAKNVKDGKLVNLKEVGYVDEKLYEKWMKEKLNPFDILLTSEAPLGEVAMLISNTKYCLSQRLFAIRANEKCKPTYLYSFLRSKVGKENVQKRATGSTVVGIRQSELRNIEILLPNIEIQIAFEEVVKPLLTKIDENYNEVNILTQTRDTLLPKLMSGKIEVK